MSKTMGVSPVTDTIYYGVVKDGRWQKREDVTDIAIKAVFEYFMHKVDKECPAGGTYQIRFTDIPYVLEIKKKES